MLNVGFTHTLTEQVNENNTADKIGSGILKVYSTPSMIALMEKTASEGIGPLLEEGFTTVGTLVNIKHLAATPVGMEITCTATLTEIDGRRLVFSLTASDPCGVIGEGVHERFIVQGEKFIAKTYSKLTVGK